MSRLVVLTLLLAGCASAPSPVELSTPAHGVVGVRAVHLDPEFWIQRTAAAERIVLDETAVAAQNEKLMHLDPSMRDIERLPSTLADSEVRELIANLSRRARGVLYGSDGLEVDAGRLDALEANVNLAALPRTQATRYGMIVQRADLRTFPTRQRVFSSRGNTNIDRFQENALFPGTPVAIVHTSADGEWWFVLSNSYAAWIERRHVAEGSAAAIFGYGRKTPYLIVTGATARTVFTPDQPGVSQLQLDMGVRVPLLDRWPADKLVNGQHPYTAHVVELPVRAADGSLQFTPALLPRTADVASDYLPLNRANLLRQSFKFLGERYGWGHSYNARDCSGFVSEVYRGFGVQLPRNTGDQAASPALNRIAFTADDDHETRLAVLGTLQVGDLIYIPRHVMMVIGRDGGMPYVIHDTTGITYRDAAGKLTRVDLNGVSVTPLAPLLLGESQPLIDGIHSILRIRP
jgi:cell wall-associated NlpC family hydrolase